MNNHETTARVAPIIVHLVHGTWARNGPWTQQGSFFQTRLKRRLSELGVGAEIEFTAPLWGGLNRHSSRLDGVQSLRDEVRKRDGEGVSQLLVGHSHGGVVCFLACKEGERSIASQVDGVVCLSTPFLVFRPAPYSRWMYTGCWVAWWLLAIFGSLLVVDDVWKGLLLSLPVVLAFTAFLRWALRHGYSDPEAISVPSSLPVPALLIRCPGDEASGILGASLVAERVMLLLTGKVGAVWAWFDRHWLMYLLFAGLSGITVGAALLASMALTGSVEALKWPAIAIASLFALVLVVPLLLGWPLRSLIYGLSYGFDMATKGVFLDVTAESTPPGSWLLHTIFPRRPESWLPGMAHSEPYDNDEAIDTIARWMSELIGKKVVGRSLLMACAILLAPATVLYSQTVSSLRSDKTIVRSYDGREMPAEFVQVTVPERRARPGRTVTVAALRLPATATHPGRPIVFLMGGPGIPGTVMAPIPPYFTLFQRLREIADVIIVDQRGIGRSEPALDCPLQGALPVDAFVHTDGLVAAMRQQVAACASEWRGRGADPTAYTTTESADDLDDLRRALGVEKIDLLAFSYGTRLALAVLQRHGDHVGRMILQGVNGPGLVVKRPGPVARKLQRIGELLKKDPAWQGPTDLLATARAARERLTRSAATIIVNDRRSGQPLTLLIGREGFDAMVALNLDDGRLPALLVSVAAGDDRVLTRFVETAWNGLNGGTVGLMARAVNCAADRPDARWTIAAQESATAPFGWPIDNAYLTAGFCQAAGYDTPPIEFPKPVGDATLVLMITGELDATNPIENARDVARGFPNAVILEVENAAHEALPVPAVQDAVVEFLNDADVRGRRIAASTPHFASIAEALQPSPQRGR